MTGFLSGMPAIETLRSGERAPLRVGDFIARVVYSLQCFGLKAVKRRSPFHRFHNGSQAGGFRDRMAHVRTRRSTFVLASYAAIVLAFRLGLEHSSIGRGLGGNFRYAFASFAL